MKETIKKAVRTKRTPSSETSALVQQMRKLTETIGSIEEIEDKLIIANTIFEHSSEGIMITDAKHVIRKINPGFSIITGYNTQEAVGKTAAILKSNRHDQEFYKGMWDSLSSNGVWQGEIWNRRKNGEIYPEWLEIVIIKDKKEAVTGYIGIFTDITRYINKNLQIRNHAYYDTLTGLPNRLLLNDRLSFMLNHARRNNQVMAILLLDLNRFKFVNDTLGYTIGDLLLQSVAARLKSCLRDVDAVFRLGDDEFAIILEEIGQQNDAAKVAKRILAVCSLPYQLSSHELYINISIGISIFPADGEDLNTLLKNAEAAMNRAKELGINNYQHYKPAMNARAFEQLTLEYNLRKALKQNEFTVYYQPIVNMATGRITGAEALMRWIHPELGTIFPGQFIPLAEETGLILPIGEWVLRTACTQAHVWQQQYEHPLRIAVNLSARQFQQQDMVATISRALADASLPPELLEVEITESLGMKNPEMTLRTLQELKDMGIHIAIDDFGTGYSSLNYLKRFPINTLKIDRSFVNEIPGDANDSAIVLAIIALAHSLNLTVVAEGVEKQEQAQYLKSNGCEKVQGYLYSPPVSIKEFESLLKKSEQFSIT